MKRDLITAAAVILLLLILVGIGTFAGCGGPEPVDKPADFITVTSNTFKDGDKLPNMYSCYGLNVSPHIAWTPGPDGTQFYVLLMDDVTAPDKPVSHWILYNIPGTVLELHEGISTNGVLKSGSIQGRNDMMRLGYYGPCYPQGEHTYVFTVYAVDTYFQMPAGWRQDVVNAMQGHVLAQGRLTCKYGP